MDFTKFIREYFETENGQWEEITSIPSDDIEVQIEKCVELSKSEPYTFFKLICEFDDWDPDADPDMQNVNYHYETVCHFFDGQMFIRSLNSDVIDHFNEICYVAENNPNFQNGSEDETLSD